MKKLPFTPKDLKDGKEFTFSPDENTHFLDDDFREATVSFSDRTNHFVIWFNGAVVHASKTFPSLEKKLNQLVTDWNLTEVTETTVEI